MSKARILLIEDVDDHADFVEDRLRWLGSDVIRARGRADGLELARRLQPDFIVLDIELDGYKYQGVAILDALEKDPKLANIPVIAFSIHARGDDQVRLVRKGARWSIDKNADNALALLEATIDGELRRRTQDRTAEAGPALPLWFDAASDRLYILGAEREPSGLTARESKVLAFLCGRAGQVCRWEDLAEAVGDAEGNMTLEAVDKMMKRLREKLGDGAQFISRLPGGRWKLLTGDGAERLPIPR